MCLSRFAAAAAVLLLYVCACTVQMCVYAQISVTISSDQDRHLISPLIYGINTNEDDMARYADNIPYMRVGGNAMSRFNYLDDTTCSGADWYWECHTYSYDAKYTPAPDNSVVHGIMKQATKLGVNIAMAVPSMGWIASKTTGCSCPNSKCSNGNDAQWNPTCYDCKLVDDTAHPECTWASSFKDPHLVNVAVNSSYAASWAAYLSGLLGKTAPPRIYQIDNEPQLWPFTHKDVHPELTTYDEYWTKMRDNAAAIKKADPSALIAAPNEWGMLNYLYSALDVHPPAGKEGKLDYAAHNNVYLVPWLLNNSAQYEKTHGERILHYLDLHVYPQEDYSYFTDTLRILYDKNYLDHGWQAQALPGPIALIPTMKQWVENYYPGTKTAIGEYNFNMNQQADTPTALVIQTLTLGIFGREGLDAANIWDPPKVDTNAWAAFKLFRNFDGAKGSFERMSVRATSSAKAVFAFAAVSPPETPAAEQKMTVVLVNSASSAVANMVVTISPAFLATGSGVRLYSGPSSGGSSAITSVALSMTSKNTITIPNMPAKSVHLLLVPGVDDGMHPQPQPSSTAPAPAPKCFITVTDLGSNNYWFSYNVAPAAGYSVTQVLAHLDTGAQKLNGPFNWGAGQTMTYTLNPSEVSLPFTLEAKDASGAVCSVSITSFTKGAVFTC